ncbi:unnamed protein product [Linum trigynum]|uniref:DUF4283 domain-containing protein n=1 Tax=Linum trigynum TaxID=586398 RepID=A0AAV2G9E6_9ROSI
MLTFKCLFRIISLFFSLSFSLFEGNLIGRWPPRRRPLRLVRALPGRAFLRWLLTRGSPSVPPEKVKDGFRIPNEVKEKGAERWKDSLVGQFVGKRPEVVELQSWANKLWGRDGLIRVSRFGPKMLVFQFPSSSSSSSDWVLTSGPWHFKGNSIFFRKWEVGIQPVESKVATLPIWVTIRGLPLEYLGSDGVEWVARVVGKLLWTDQTTRVGAQLGFSKVCIELAADCGFPRTICFYPHNDPDLEIGMSIFNYRG